MTITVLGASGKTGGAVAGRLLAAGVSVRAVARSRDRLASLTAKGAAAVAADIADAGALARALEGSDAVYAMIPGDYTRPDLLGQYARGASGIAGAIRAARVRRVVFLSSLGAELPSGTGPIAGLHGAEQALRAIPGLELLVLRPGYFYENQYGTLGLIKQQGINGGAIAPDAAMTMIAARDIGEAAADALLKNDFSGVRVRDMGGPRRLTMTEATRIIGRAIGKPDLPYVQFPPDGFVTGLKSNGFTDDAARLFAEMSDAFNRGLIKPQPGNDFVSTPTTFEAFAEEFARAFQAA
ncbi:MAG TPA: NAD(P)H-binding protein [Polyangia bacterium]|nr:NAD(P)H-binding protein [Polyangia bacterium]